MKPRPKPLTGLVLGLLLGVVVAGLLWQLGVAPPDRFILFGVLALAVAAVELLLTQTTRRGKKRFVTSMVIAGVFGGVALTGIPETFLSTGSISEPCTLTVASATDEATPADTSAFDPFDTTPDGTVSFIASTGEELRNWDSGLGMSIGGVPITLFTAQRDNATGATQFSGEEPVQGYLDQIEDQIGLQLRGTYNVFGYIHADQGDCDANGYLRINAEGAFATPLIVALWVAGGLLVILIVSLAVSVRRSIREAKLYGEAGRPAKEPAKEPVAETRVLPVAQTEALPTRQEDPAPASGADESPEEPKAT